MRRYIFIILLLCSLSSCASLSLSSESEDVIYFSEYLDNTTQLRTVDTSQNVKTVTPPELNEIRGGFDLSPTKRFLALADAEGISIFEIITGKLERITNFGYSPKWSSDEKWIVFRSQEYGTHTIDKVHAINLDTRKIYTPDRVANNIPISGWSPQNNSIIFEAYVKDGVNYSTDQTGIYIYDTSQEKGHFLIKDDNLSLGYPVISPNGEYILYEEERNYKDRSFILAKLMPKFEIMKIIYTGNEIYWNPVWSPDNKYFMTIGNNDTDILIYNNQGNIINKITMKEWWIKDMTWGESDTIHAIRLPDDGSPYTTFSQVVEINLKNKHEKVLHISTNAIYLP